MGNEMSALRLYLPLVRLGKAFNLQKIVWSRLLLFQSLVSLSVFLVLLFFWFGFGGEEERILRFQKSLVKWLHSPFYNGECRVSVK